jgi:phosphoserine aminotransferase|tara:strand:+ start:8468 stop:9481 length:1014 start_codon:yes stop_codon:yes gene_type:complete
LQSVIDLSKEILDIPRDYHVGIVPASDTGAFEMAMWSLLGERGVDVFAWESFGQGWLSDVKNQLGLGDLRAFEADYGELPDLSAADWTRDVLFTWNGTTSGVKVPNGEWIAPDRAGLSLCDATSALFAMHVDWSKLDVVTWSWQKVLGGEAAHGMLAISPRAVERLESYAPPWPLPKIFRITKGGKLNESIFQAATINTPSMLAVEDQLDTLQWAEDIGGLDALVQRSEDNLRSVEQWVAETPWVDFLAADASVRSSTSICLKIVDAWFSGQEQGERAAITKKMVGLLEDEGVAYDINGYRDAPPGLRVWGGSTVSTADIDALLPWLDWAYSEVKSS